MSGAAADDPLLRQRLLELTHGHDGLLAGDAHGRVRLLTMPRLSRSSMKPHPAPRPTRERAPWHNAALRRRWLFLLLVLLQTGAIVTGARAALPYHGDHWMELPLLALEGLLVAWVSAGFWMALMGFWMLLRHGGEHFEYAPRLPAGTPLAPEARTAILMPVYNEAVPRVFAGIRAMLESLERAGAKDRFDFFVLSDSTDADVRVDELRAWVDLCRAVNGFGRLYYRHRRARIKGKSGNIADWCRRWGRGYRYMAVLDADSIMSGACLVHLVQLMEAHPRAGILQTVPMPFGRETLFARVQQFASHLCSPLLSAGIHFWHLGEAYYWGHNAVIRIAPFMRHCALARLPQRGLLGGLLGGEIRSHDFVEAALMRRAHWHVWVLWDLPGSWEELPPTLLEELRRDRRWCHGNLQHSRMLLTPGLHPAHRALFMAGMMNYLSSLLWFAFLILCTVMLAVQVLAPPAYFTEPYQLFPRWPEWRPLWAIALFGVTFGLLLIPRFLAAAFVLRDGAKRFGGPDAFIASFVLEILLGVLLGPIRMLFHAGFVASALLGIKPRWVPPSRDDAQTTWAEAVRRHGAGTLIGAAWIALAAWLHPAFLPWLLPVAGALCAAIPLSVWTSKASAGAAARRERLFLTPVETQMPTELARLRQLLAEGSPAGGLKAARSDPFLGALVRAADPRYWRDKVNFAA